MKDFVAIISTYFGIQLGENFKFKYFNEGPSNGRELFVTASFNTEETAQHPLLPQRTLFLYVGSMKLGVLDQPAQLVQDSLAPIDDVTAWQDSVTPRA